jgi:antitoxin component HigA of HigAB toxin-antitoxin module
MGKENVKTSYLLHLSTTADSKISGQPWVKFQSAGWVNIQSAPTAYEHKHFPTSPADPVEAIKFRMEQQGLTPKDLERYIGSSGRVSEVLNRKRRLSLQMVKRLHDGLHIPYESLLAAA